MADLYLKALESERKALWATCRLKGLARHEPERQRIDQLDGLIAEHKAKQPQKAKPAPAAKPAKKKAKPATKAKQGPADRA